ncbi:uncharacterized protein LOC124268142 isoform X1 [Haliotis rubra]|uniref:uncharacterized protein LOC124268142 isoform X1 n=1 Tax=Haliotis rubra TaxID=36100 RepID=UPI001EE6224C|nr:uncharacterized protein LOC124268142 isoform X1 [Haliotis rubra]
MITKVAILTLVAISINGCFGIPVIQNCTLVDLGDDVEALTCGSETVTRFKNGTLIDTQYFANETLSVLQFANETSACYLHRSVPLPDEIDFVQASETDVRQEANAETSAAIVALVPQCAGRVVYELVPETDATTTGRKKRWCRYVYRCYYYRIYYGWYGYRWYRYCKFLYVC